MSVKLCNELSLLGRVHIAEWVDLDVMLRCVEFKEHNSGHGVV